MYLELELDFLSGKIFDLQELPKSKKYLYRYFATYEQKLFVKYFLTHGCHDQFVAHTGVRFRRRWRQYLAQRLRYIESAWQEARDAGDMEAIVDIESGRMKVPTK